MPYIAYRKKRFAPAILERIKRANAIIAEYAKQGLTLTLRQLYYQFVSRDWLVNSQKNYKQLGETLNDARIAGLVDWNAIEDRTRNLIAPPSWDDPADIISACANQFRLDRWNDQPNYCEVWIEKDALTGVIDKVCRDNSVPYFSCRGYPSQSEVWRAAQRLGEKTGDQDIHIIHLGDHDPSGCDMTRDIEDRLNEFSPGSSPIEIHRVALNMDQIKKYRPPPNPAKITDSRARAYIAQHGRKSWELDALEPSKIVDLVRKNILALRDDKKWQAKLDEEARHKGDLTTVALNWTGAVKGATKRKKK